MKYLQCFYLQWKSNALTDKLCPILRQDFLRINLPYHSKCFLFFSEKVSLCFQDCSASNSPSSSPRKNDSPSLSSQSVLGPPSLYTGLLSLPTAAIHLLREVKINTLLFFMFILQRQRKGLSKAATDSPAQKQVTSRIAFQVLCYLHCARLTEVEINGINEAKFAARS